MSARISIAHNVAVVAAADDDDDHDVDKCPFSSVIQYMFGLYHTKLCRVCCLLPSRAGGGASYCAINGRGRGSYSDVGPTYLLSTGEELRVRLWQSPVVFS